MEKKELIILGAGSAGLSAAIYAKRAGLDVVVIEEAIPGGQIRMTDEIENWPGDKVLSGYDLGEKFQKHAEHLEAEIIISAVHKLEIGEQLHKVTISGDKTFVAPAVIIATGSRLRKLGCPGEDNFAGRGVSYCAVCDAAFFLNQNVAVIGGGNTAVEEALYLTRFAKTVYLVHRRDKFRADNIIVERAFKNPKIIPVWNSLLTAIEGGQKVEKIAIESVIDRKMSYLDVSGVFMMIGNTPNTDFLAPDSLATIDGGWIVTNNGLETSVKGIYAAGDVRDSDLKQVVTAAADGARAAVNAYNYISSL